MAGSPCYVTGTRIATGRGEIAVEDLRIGDLAVTAAGELRPIRWIGTRRIDCRTYGDPEEVMPVRIVRGAFGPSRPSRDLVLSPGHSICIDVVGEVLIPIASLVSGATVRQEAAEHVTYWHVELDSHDVLLAEGMPAESYMDTGNRSFFAESDVVGLHAAPDADPATRTHADFCRPFRDTGPVIEAVRERLRDRAFALGWRLEHDLWVDTHLVVDGARVDPTVESLSARFAMPAGAHEVWLVSEAAAPSHVGFSSDTRMPGVCVEGLHINDVLGPSRSVDLADPALRVGFFAVEEGPRRWTNGRAHLPVALWAGCRDRWPLRLDLTGTVLPRWHAPVDPVHVEHVAERFEQSVA